MTVSCRCAAMVSSSSTRSRSRSDRRGPSEPAADSVAKPSEDGAAAPEGVDGETTSEKAVAAVRTEKHASQPADDRTQPRPSQSRKPGGARKNWRKAGDPDTWECPDCLRVIADNEASKDQHRVSAYCFARRLWKVGAFYGDWPTCEKYGKEWANDPEAYELRGCHFYQVKAPKAYLERPRSPGQPASGCYGYGHGRHYERNRRRGGRSEERRGAAVSRSRSKRCRLRSRGADKQGSTRSADRGREDRLGRSADRGRKDRSGRSADRGRKDRSGRSADRGRKDRSGRSADRKGKEKRATRSESEETVEVEEEKPRKSKPAGAASASGKDKKEKPKAAEAVKHKVKEEASSDEYTYTSSPEDKPQKKQPPVAAKAAAKAGGVLPAAKAAVHPSEGRLAMMNSLLKTAMETAAKLPDWHLAEARTVWPWKRTLSGWDLGWEHAYFHEPKGNFSSTVDTNVETLLCFLEHDLSE